MERPEEVAYYNEVLERVRANPRWYLNNLSELSVFRVSFENYHKKVPRELKRSSKKKSFIKKVTPYIYT
jgi:hypothetical protein